MRTIFNNGFKRSPWDRILGQDSDPYAPTVFPWEQPAATTSAGTDWGAFGSGLITGGGKAYESYEQGQIAKDKADAEQARADAARTAADAERAKAAAAASAAAAAAARAGQGGIPPGYLILGGLGVAAAIVAAIALSK
jgi:hypothetical protein